MSIDLNPSVLKESGFIAAIEWIRDSMAERFGLTVKIESTLSYQRLESTEIEALAFQCVRELLFNVVKHAETKQAEIELNEPAAGELFISVRDKGIGFELGGTSPAVKIIVTSASAISQVGFGPSAAPLI